MTREVMINIQGVGQIDPAEETKMSAVAQYYQKNGSHYVIYDETDKENGANCKNIIKFRENYLEVTRKGDYNVHMLFEKNKKNISNYGTPFGTLIIGINTKQMEIREEAEQIAIQADYELDINDEHVAGCRINIDINNRKTG